MKYNKKGEELLDPTPVAMPLNFKRPPTMNETIARLVKLELSQQAAGVGAETFAEADDFEVGDDYDPKSPYELGADQELNGEWPDEVLAQDKAATAAVASEAGVGVEKTKNVAPSAPEVKS